MKISRIVISRFLGLRYLFRAGLERVAGSWESGHMEVDRVLTEKIEDLVRELADEQMVQLRQAVVATVVGALAGAKTATKSATKKKATRRTAGRRRNPAEVTALSERLHKAVCARPGEAMVVFATELGVTVRELHRPMANLKRAGQVRSVGERHRTRYFQSVAGAAVAAVA